MAPPALDSRVVAASTAALRSDRDLPYSSRQLWYAVCARLERGEVTEGTAQVVAGMVMIAIGVAAGILVTLFVALLVPVGMVITGLGVERRRAERNRPTTRPLAVSFDAFVRDTLAPLRARAGTELSGLLPDDAASPALPAEVAPAGDHRPLLVCDRGETAAVLSALVATAADLDIDVLDETLLPPAPVLARRPVYAVHDADSRGCDLPLRLAAAGATRVVDCGLRPDQITQRHVQVIEGAPARVDRALAALLSADEIIWLAEGHRTELAILGSGELLDGLRRLLAAEPVPPPGGAEGPVALGGASLFDPGNAPDNRNADDDLENRGPAEPSGQSTPT